MSNLALNAFKKFKGPQKKNAFISEDKLFVFRRKYFRKKKAATKKPTSLHKDSKSHNVKISVVSGNLKHNHITTKFYDDLKDEILMREDVIHDVTVVRKAELIQKNGKMWFNKWVKDAKNIVKAQKKLLTQIKKSI